MSDDFADALHPFYEDNRLFNRWEDDLDYLRRAYERTEYFYKNNFVDLDMVRLVILAEAPLYGAREIYIYNPDAPHTNFLWPSNLAGIAGRETSGMLKTDYLFLLRQLGILIVDIFPYALNNDDTGLVYKKKKGSPAVELTLSQKKALARAVKDFHVRPKLEQIADKGGPTVRFCARYKPIGEIAKEIYPALLEELGFTPSNFAVISMQGGMIDQHALTREYEKALKG